MEKLMLGIDVSKDTLSCTLLDPATRKPLWQTEVKNTKEGIRVLLGRTQSDSPWVLEPTGRYSLCAAQMAKDAGRSVLLAPSRRAKSFLQSVQSRAKTDRIDSSGLALFALSQPLPPYPLKSEKLSELNQLLLARRGIAQAITSLEQRIQDLPYAGATLKEAVLSLKTRLEELDQKIEAVGQEPDFAKDHQRLDDVPGIGPVTAAALLSRLKERSFGHSDQFVAYIGLDIGVRRSGKMKGERGLTKQGDAELRRLLYVCALAAVRKKGSPFKLQFDKERQKGLPKTAAYCAVARKMARLCWSLVHHQSDYDEQFVYQQIHPSKRAGSEPSPPTTSEDMRSEEKEPN
jgi:transposase